MRDCNSVILTQKYYTQFKSTFSGDLSAYAIKAEFLDYNIEKGVDEKFVIYPIKIYNANYENIIYKRFGEFHVFYKELKERYKNIKIPKLPKKSLINNFESEFLEVRKAKLQKFLNEILGILRYKFIIEICSFIELSQASINCILDLGQSEVTISDTFMGPYLSVMYNEQDLKGRLEKLKALLMSEKAPKEFIRLLFQGRDSLKSLFQFSFNRDWRAEKHRFCFQVVDFMIEMLENKNPNQDEFQRLLKVMREKDFRSMNFSAHLCSQEISRCKMACNKLLKIFQNLNPQANMFFLFSSYEEYEKFKTWKSAIEHRFSSINSFFPHYIDFLENEIINPEIVIRTLDVYGEKNNLDMVISNTENCLLKAGFMVNESQKDLLLESIPSNGWLLKMFDDSVIYDTHIFNLLKVKKKSPKFVLVRPLTSNTIIRDTRTIVYFLPIESEIVKEHLINECPALKSIKGAPPSHQMREKYTYGFFFDIESIPNTRKYVFSILVKYFPRSTQEFDRQKKLEQLAKLMQEIQGYILGLLKPKN
jgi:hypothetical protein